MKTSIQNNNYCSIHFEFYSAAAARSFSKSFLSFPCKKLKQSRTVRVENFVQFKILPYLENFVGINSAVHVYNFRVISHSRKTQN